MERVIEHKLLIYELPAFSLSWFFWIFKNKNWDQKSCEGRTRALELGEKFSGGLYKSSKGLPGMCEDSGWERIEGILRSELWILCSLLGICIFLKKSFLFLDWVLLITPSRVELHGSQLFKFFICLIRICESKEKKKDSWKRGHLEEG